MWELSPSHCCSTCCYSHNQASVSAKGGVLFPLSAMRLCEFHKAGLKDVSAGHGNVAVQAVLVRPDGRCESYDCDENKYRAEHGNNPEF